MIYRNVPNQKLYVKAWDVTTGLPATGDAANLTAYVQIDYGTLNALTDTSATALSSGNAAGTFLFDLTQAETSGNVLYFACKSSTPNVVCMDQVVLPPPSGWMPTITLPEITGAGNIPPNPTISQIFMLWYMFLRNDGHVSTTMRAIYNNAGISVVSGVMNDDGTTFNQGKLQ